MKFKIVAILLSASISAPSILSQSISLSYSLLFGSDGSIPARYPSGYGAFNSGNTPGARGFHKIIVYKNMVYLFHGFPSPASSVWTFNISDRTWAWITGDSLSDTPSYGARGVASVSNNPGYRYGCGGDFHRQRGEYILFGGGNVVRGDLWSFNLTSNLWTWLAGLSSYYERPIYTRIWSSNVSTTPGGRSYSQSAIYPETGEFLLYGGLQNGQSLADMWAFNFDNSRWTWISGSSVGDVAASVGPKGEWSTAYYPAARYGAVDLVLIPESKTLYIFGGSSPLGYMNDLWAFKRDTIEWAWISGSTTPNIPGVCGTMGYPSRNNYPGSRYHHSTLYYSQSQLIVMSGGYGYTCVGTNRYLTDIWTFNVRSNEWAWIAGSSVADWPGILGGKMGSAIFFDADTSAMYMFGGYGNLSRANMGYSDNIVQISVLFGNSTINNSTNITYARPTLASTPTIVIATSIFGPLIPVSSPTNFQRFWSFKYLIMAVFVIVFVTTIVCCANILTRSRKMRDDSHTGDEPSETNSTFQYPSQTKSSTIGNSTLASSTVGIYLPGGLQVDAASAYTMRKELARGGGGSVWLATALEPALKEYGETVIVKIPKVKQMNERSIALFHQEIALMNAFKKSHNIVTLLGYSENPSSAVLKYYPRGSLSNWLSSSGRTLLQIHAFLKDISLGIALLHQNGIVHCDLKPDNVLIDSGWRLFAVITDFGISRIVTDKLLKIGAYEVQKINGASLAYAAPESLLELRGIKLDGINQGEIMARDIYAIGMIIAALVNGKD